MIKRNTISMTAIRDRVRGRRAARAAQDALARDLATFDTHAELVELSAMLDRYDDDATEPIRRSVNWVAA